MLALTNKQRSLLQSLKSWHAQAQQHQIPYRLAFGSLLGWARNGHLIAHDSDIDVLIDPTSLETLDRLTQSSHSWYVDQEHHPPLPALPHNSSSVLLHRSSNHRLEFGTFPRIDCTGNATTKMKDACSFAGPVARIVAFDSIDHAPISYIDLYISGCSFHRPFGRYKNRHCRVTTSTCSFCPSGEATPGSLITQSGGGLRPCFLSGVATYCPASMGWTRQHLAKLYGGGWGTINKHYTYSDRPSKRRL